MQLTNGHVNAAMFQEWQLHLNAGVNMLNFSSVCESLAKHLRLT